MSYLVMSRRVRSYVHFDIQPGADPEVLLAQLRDVGITVSIAQIIDADHVRLGIGAPRSIRVRRDEVVKRQEGEDS